MFLCTAKIDIKIVNWLILASKGVFEMSSHFSSPVILVPVVAVYAADPNGSLPDYHPLEPLGSFLRAWFVFPVLLLSFHTVLNCFK